MRRSTERKTLHKHFITGFHATTNQSQMNSCCTGRQTNYFPIQLTPIRIMVDEILQILFESIHIRSHGYHPIGIKCFLYIFLFPTLFAHVGETEVNCFSFF